MDPNLIDNADIRVEPVGKVLRLLGVVSAAARPIGRAETDQIICIERVYHGLAREVVGAGGTDTAQNAARGGIAGGGDEGAGEV